MAKTDRTSKLIDDLEQRRVRLDRSALECAQARTLHGSGCFRPIDGRQQAVASEQARKGEMNVHLSSFSFLFLKQNVRENPNT